MLKIYYDDNGFLCKLNNNELRNFPPYNGLKCNIFFNEGELKQYIFISEWEIKRLID